MFHNIHLAYIFLSDYRESKEVAFMPCTPHRSKAKMGKFLQTLVSLKKNPIIRKLRHNDCDKYSNRIFNYSDFVKILADLGQEQQFEVTYVDVDEKSDGDEVQCLVQLSTLPVAVCYGVGEDIASANNDAARNALNYLKMMTKGKTDPAETSSSSNTVKNGESSDASTKEDTKNEGAETEAINNDENTNKTSKKGKEAKNGK